jgi:hypothetical protein
MQAYLDLLHHGNKQNDKQQNDNQPNNKNATLTHSVQ